MLLFQSTPSVWRETSTIARSCLKRSISIHSLRVEGDEPRRCDTGGALISIHSLRVEGDVVWRWGLSVFNHFNPLPPCGGRLVGEAAVHRHTISIHSLRVEGDFVGVRSFESKRNFNPLPPCGGRHTRLRRQIHGTYFNPLPPCGGRLIQGYADKYTVPISIHSLRVEGDTACKLTWNEYLYFNPLPPCGGRQTTFAATDDRQNFNPLPPCGGRRAELTD